MQPPPPVPPRVQAVYEESVATGTFRRMHATDALVDAWGRPATAAAAKSSSDADLDESVPPKHSMARALDAYWATVWRLCLFILTGAVLAVTVTVEKQNAGGAAAAIAFLATFLAPLRLLMYLLAMVAWLGLADQYLQRRSASRAAMEAAFRQRAAVEAGAGASALAALIGQQQRQTLSSGIFVTLALASQTVVAATVLASNVLDNRIRMQAGVPASTITGNASILQDFAAWRVLLFIRLAGCLAALLCLACTLSGPSQVDAVVAERLSEAAPIMAGAGSGGGAGGAGVAGGTPGALALCGNMDALTDAALMRLSREELRALAAAGAALSRRAEATRGALLSGAA